MDKKNLEGKHFSEFTEVITKNIIPGNEKNYDDWASTSYEIRKTVSWLSRNDSNCSWRQYLFCKECRKRFVTAAAYVKVVTDSRTGMSL